MSALIELIQRELDALLVPVTPIRLQQRLRAFVDQESSAIWAFRTQLTR
jgi:hypothetical protein